MGYFNTEVTIDPKTVAQVLPCPFCGVMPEIMTSGERSRGLMIQCIADDCANPSVSYYNHEIALAVWNRRAVSVSELKGDGGAKI